MNGIRVEFTDQDLQFRVTSFLKSRHFPAFDELDIEVHDGSVTLAGSLPSFYEKQVAINSCQRVAGVLALIDEIVVSVAGDDAELAEQGAAK